MRSLFPALLLSGLCPAQVFVVDAANGPGASFMSIAAAVAAVPDGAVLQVRPGTYAGFTIQGKSLRVFGDPGVLVSDLLLPPISIDGLAQSQIVVLRGLGIHNALGPGTILCQNAAGQVVIDACVGDTSISGSGGRVLASNCAQLHVRHSSFLSAASGSSAITASASNVLLTGCTLGGFFGPTLLLGGGLFDVNACTISGIGVVPPIQLNGGELRVRGQSTITAASAPGFLPLAISGTGAVFVDPNTTLINVPSPPFGAGLTVTQAAMPYLLATPGQLGGSATASLSGPAGSINALVIGLCGQPYLPPGIAEPVWLQPGTERTHAIGGARVQSGYGVPNAPWVLGLTVCWQGAAWSASAGLQLSNPIAYSHH